MATKEWIASHQEEMRAYRRKWYALNKDHAKSKVLARKTVVREWFSALKAELKCARCDENHIAALDFHHNDQAQKDMCISEAVNRGWGKKRILEEIAKCVVLCSNCHRKHHAET